MENKEKDGYNGFWKHLGCALFAIVGLVFLWIIFTILKMALFK